jgi:acyl-CoA thioesterase-1
VASSLFRYIALGDSTGVGVGSGHDGGYPERLYQRLKKAGINAGILNLAQSGATTADVIHGPLGKTMELRPALVTLGIGTNDLWRLVPPQTFEKNLQRIADGLQQTGAHVVVSGMVAMQRAPIASMVGQWGIPIELLVARIRQFDSLLQALGARKNFTVVDLYSISEKAEDVSAWFSNDGFHPSPKGYDRWAEELWPHVERVARGWAQPVQKPTP